MVAKKNTESANAVEPTAIPDIIFGDMVCRYVYDRERGCVGLSLFPAGLPPVERREAIDEPETRFKMPGLARGRAAEVESVVQMHCGGDAVPVGYAQGLTMRGGGGSSGWRMESLVREPIDGGEGVVLKMSRQNGMVAEHRLVWRKGSGTLEAETSVSNSGSRPQDIEMLSSCAIDGITPYARDDAPNQLKLHRARSYWSAEGGWEGRYLEALGLERSWQPHAVRCERFGQAGSLPVRGWFPCAVIEDTVAGVSWGLQLVWPGSWQIEIYRRGDAVSLSGGLADFELGQWRKKLAPGETFCAPKALITVCRGGVNAATARLVRGQAALRENGWMACEEHLPVICNEFCSSWGEPTEASIAALAERLECTGVRYLVIDAGWYCNPGESWADSHGDWMPGEKRFPHGLAATTQLIRSHGLVPGLWFEPETVGAGSKAYHDIDALLMRDGRPVTVGSRRFLDLRKPDVFEKIVLRIVSLVRECGIGYVKFDYNETIGVGVDGAESRGEGLRQHMVAVLRFYARLKAELPDVVFEVCASGGHRLEPSLMAIADMASFSDAHESDFIALLAAAQHRLVNPRQLQIWAVLRPELSCGEIRRVLVNAFLGRLCLSGSLQNLNAEQWGVVTEALALYQAAVPVIRDGITTVFPAAGCGLRHRQGGQVVVRVSTSVDAAIMVATGFGAGAFSMEAVLPYPGVDRIWRVSRSIHGQQDEMCFVGTATRIVLSDVGMAGVWLLEAVPIQVAYRATVKAEPVRAAQSNVCV